MRWTIRALLLAAALACGMFAWGAWVLLRPVALPRVPFAFHLPQGSSLTAAARQLGEAGLLPSPRAFTLLARLRGLAGELKAGNYELRDPLSPVALLDKLTRGDVSQSEITFIEGWTFRQLRRRLDEHPQVRHELVGLSEREVLTALAAVETAAEGLFFPDTYHFPRGTSDLDILRRAYRTMQEHLQREWENRLPDLPYATPYEALIVASLVEKEAGQVEEMPLIASVFANRLRLGIRLQTDPSVIYGLGERFDGNLRRRDLEADGPYNTYTRAGLPPTPIAMPGLAALQSALRPARTRLLYFVARGDGSHHFSASLEEHNRAVARYQLAGRAR